MSRQQQWNERYRTKDLVWSAQPNALFAEQVSQLAPGTALDVACGEGRNAIWLAAQGWTVTGVDFSDVGIDKARQIASKRGVSVDFMVADVSSQALPRGKFDLVAVLYLHTEPAERALWLANVIQSIKAGGTFLYIGHDPSNIKDGIGGPQDPLLLPSAAELSTSLSDFSIECAEVVQRDVTQEPGHGSPASGIALDTLVRAVRR